MFVPADRCLGHKRTVNVHRKNEASKKNTSFDFCVMTSAVDNKSRFASTDAVYIMLWFSFE